MSYSTDLRQKVLDFINAGHSIESACQLFDVSRSSVQRWRLKLKNTGTLNRKHRVKSPYKIDEAALRAYIANHQDTYLSEISTHFNVTVSAISKALSRLNITRKKKPRSMQKETKSSDTLL